MGFRDYMRAATEQAKAAATELADANPEGARKLSALMTTAVDLKDQALVKVDTVLADVSETPRGQQAVKVIVRTQEEVAKLPVLTALSDTSRSLYGIGELSEQVMASPDDPWPYLWLAEALIKIKKAQQTRAIARGLVEPSSVITRAAFVTANKLADEGMSLEERLLRRAYALACQQMQSGPNVGGLHVLARVYAAVGSTEQALVAIRAAVLLKGRGEAGRAWMTYGRLLYTSKDYAAASAAAQMALTAGCTAGNEVLADVLCAETRGGLAVRAAAVQRAAELRGSVSRVDLVAYYGVHQTAMGAAAGAYSAQKEKVADTARRIRQASTSNTIPTQPTPVEVQEGASRG